MAKPNGAGIGLITRDMLRAAELTNQGRVPDCTLQDSGVLPDWAIRELITIDKFVDYGECPKGKVSYGLTSAGYDIRVGHKFKIFTNVFCAVVDPKSMPPSAFHDVDLSEFVCAVCGKDTPHDDCVACVEYWEAVCAGRVAAKPDHILIPPNSFALGETVETLYIPRNVVCWCIGKSTYARCGVNMNFTPFEPGWFGIVTVEMINATPLPVKIYAGEGIGQAEFFLMAGEPEKSYGDKPNSRIIKARQV